jgi:Cytochrome c
MRHPHRVTSRKARRISVRPDDLPECAEVNPQPGCHAISGIRLLSALIAVVATSAVHEPAAGSPRQNSGQSIYLDGVLGSGAPLIGVRQGGTNPSGAEAACVNCHQRSGLGSREGEIYIPPVTGEYLFHPHAHSGKESILPYVEGMHGNREPYTDALLARAIRDGVDSNGRPLSYLMPRFALNDADMASLVSYLRSLSAKRTPGISDAVLHLASVFTPDADPAKRAGVIDVLQHFVEEKNSFPIGPSPRMWTSGKTEYSKSMYMANRHWQLHIWELSGPPSGWRAQLERHLAQEPVFAMLSGVGGSNWEPIHDFCEQQALPCLFPNVEVPVSSDGDFYAVYFSDGVLLEAQLIVHALLSAQQRPGTVQQIYRTGDSGEKAAQALAATLSGSSVVVRSHPLAAQDGTERLLASIRSLGKTDALVLWLRPRDIAALAAVSPPSTALYLSGLMGGLEDMPLPAAWRARSLLAYPLDPPTQRGVRLDYPLGWFAFRHIPVVAEQVQVDTYLACSLLTDVLHHDMADNVSPAYLIEQLQHMLERRLITGYYPHLSLGVHQHFASKGGYLVHFAEATGSRLTTNTDWIVP